MMSSNQINFLVFAFISGMFIETRKSIKCYIWNPLESLPLCMLCVRLLCHILELSSGKQRLTYMKQTHQRKHTTDVIEKLATP